MSIQDQPDKAFFLPDFQRAEKALEKQIADPAIDFQRRTALSNKLTDLKLKWQRSDVTDAELVKALRDGCASEIREAHKMGLTADEFDPVYGDQVQHLEALNKVLEAAKAKELV